MKTKKGFTLIEIIVVIGVIAIVFPAIFSIIFAVLQAQAKVIRLSAIKNQGDFIINTLDTKIKNSAEKIYADNGLITEVCSSAGSIYPLISEFDNGTNFFMVDKNNIIFNFYIDTNIIKYNDNGVLTNLNSAQVRIENFGINCSRSSVFSAPLIHVEFDICYNNNFSCSTIQRNEEHAVMHYETKIKLRNL